MSSLSLGVDVRPRSHQPSPVWTLRALHSGLLILSLEPHPLTLPPRASCLLSSLAGFWGPAYLPSSGDLPEARGQGGSLSSVLFSQQA